MKIKTFKTRRHQIRAAVKRFKDGKQTLAELVRAIGIAASCAERDRTLKIVTNRVTRDKICCISVIDVLDIVDS